MERGSGLFDVGVPGGCYPRRKFPTRGGVCPSVVTELTQCLPDEDQSNTLSLKLLKRLVGAAGLEPATR
jgi:hypothetical protein